MVKLKHKFHPSVMFSLEAAGRQHGEEYTSLMSLNQSDEEENNDIPEGDKSQSTDSQTDSEEIMRGVCCSGLYNIKVFLLLICLFSIIHGEWVTFLYACVAYCADHSLYTKTIFKFSPSLFILKGL